MKDIVIVGYKTKSGQPTCKIILDLSGHEKMKEAFGPESRTAAPMTFQKWERDNIYTPLGMAITIALKKSDYVVCRNEQD